MSSEADPTSGRTPPRTPHRGAGRPRKTPRTCRTPPPPVTSMARAEVEAAWLGDLLGAEVASGGVPPIAAFSSRTVRLTVRYAERSPSAIDRLVLKRNDPAEWAEWAVRA